MLKQVLVAAAVAVLALSIFIGTRPDTFRVERSAEVHAPADVAFALVNDFRQWRQWSPYETLDAGQTRTYEGPEAGVGASYAWKGEKAGAGRMTIVESRPGERISLRLEFFEPFAATNMTTFTFVPSGTGTRVSWAMEGENSLMSKVMGIFMDMNAFIGKDFEQGLATLDTVARSEAKRRSQAVAVPVP